MKSRKLIIKKLKEIQKLDENKYENDIKNYSIRYNVLCFLNVKTIYCSGDLEMQIINHSIENIINNQPPINELDENNFVKIELSDNVNTSRFSTNTSLLEEVNTQSNNNYLKYSIIGIFSLSLITGTVFIIKHFI